MYRMSVRREANVKIALETMRITAQGYYTK